MRSLRLGADKQIVSLDWDAKALRVVLWRLGKGRARVVKSLTTEIPDTVQLKDASALGDFVRRVLLDARIKANSAIVDISRDQAVLNTMSLPSVNLNALAGMVQLQIAKELPFSLNDAVVDFAVTDHGDAGGTAGVVVAAIRNEVLGYYRSVCDRAGLKLERVGLRPYANKVAINEMLGARARGRVMFVDVGPRLTEIGILRDGVLVFSRAASVFLDEDEDESLPLAAGGPEARERVDPGSALELDATPPAPEPLQSATERRQVQNLLVEVTRSAEAYRSTDPGVRFDHIVVGGSSNLEPQLAAEISRRFSVQAELYDPSSVLRADSHSGGQTTAFAASVGLGIGHAEEGRLDFDFLHPKKPMDAAAKRQQYLPRVSAAVAAVAVLAAGIYYFGVYRTSRETERIRGQIKEVTLKLDKLEPATVIVHLVDELDQHQMIWPDELKHVARVFPGDKTLLYFDGLDLKAESGEIGFKVLAKNPDLIRELQSNLHSLTRTNASGKDPQPIFKVDDSRVVNDPEKRDYPARTTMTLRSARIVELIEREERRRN